MQREKLPAYKKFSIIVSVLIIISCFMPWISVQGEPYTIIALLAKSLRPGGLLSFIAETLGASAADMKSSGAGTSVLVLCVGVYVFLAVAILYCIYMILLIRNKNGVITGLCAGGLEFVMAYIYTLSFNVQYVEGVSASVFPYITTLLVAIEFLGTRLLGEFGEATRKANESRRRDKLAKAERKRRLYFPGNYSRLFFQVVWNNFRTGWKNYVLFIASASVAATFIFSSVALKDLLSGKHSKEILMFEDGLSSILSASMRIVIFLAVFLIAFVLTYYIRSRMESYGMFMIIGIRKKTFILYAALEFFGSLTVSFFMGLIVGYGIIRVFIFAVHHSVSTGFVSEMATGKVIGSTVLLYILTFVIAAIINYELFEDMGLSRSMAKSAAGERMPVRFIRVVPLIGIYMMGHAVNMYRYRQWAESKVYIGIFLAGLFLVMRFGFSLLLRRKKKTQSYYHRLLADNNFYHRFKSSTNYMYVLTVIHFLALSILSIRLISCLMAEPVKTLYPYDYVCFASDEDMSYLKQAGDECDASVKTYPIVRVTAVDGSEQMDELMKIILPQSQNIGISESTYRQLEEAVGIKGKEELNIRDDDVYIVYQQDKSVKAHPVDWYMLREKPYLHIGLPLYQYDVVQRESYFPPRNVAGEEYGSVIGVFNRGMQENLIVFSDEYFEQARIEAEGPSLLVTMKVPEKNRAAMEERLEKFQENHKLEESYDRAVKSWYSKELKEGELISERLLNESIAIFILLILLTVSLCIFYIKNASEREMLKQKYKFLECIGMRREERRKTLSREMGAFIVIPLILAVIFSAVFTGITFYLRMYTVQDIWSYIRIGLGIWGGYIVIQIVVYLLLRRNILHYIERD